MSTPREVSKYGVFLVGIFRIWTEYGDLLRKSPYSVQMWENMNQKNSAFGQFLRSATMETPEQCVKSVQN